MIFFPANDRLEGVFHSFYFDFPNEQTSLIEVTSSSIWWGNPYNLINYTQSPFENETCFATGEKTPNITFKLQKHKLKISGYSLKTRSTYKENQPRTWELEGSIDGERWTIIHSVSNYSKFQDLNITQTFSVTKKGAFSYFRIRGSGPNWSEKGYIVLQNVEFFGRLCGSSVENEKCYLPPMHSCQKVNYFQNIHTSTLYIFFFLLI